MVGVAIVTGASRGIGAAVARMLGTRGYRVCVNYRSEHDAAERVAAEIVEAGGEAIVVQGDVSDREAVRRLFETVDERLGPVTALVNNAGIHGPRTRVDDLALDDLEAVLAVNVVGLVACSQEAVRRMSTRHGGRGGAIVNVSSTLSERVATSTAVYAATKAALNALTRALALELAPVGVRVNAVLPGGVDTDMLRAPRLRPGESLKPDELGRHVDEQLAALAALHPLGRLGTPAEVAAVIVHALDQTWQTGSLLTIDGGLGLKA